MPRASCAVAPASVDGGCPSLAQAAVTNAQAPQAEGRVAQVVHLGWGVLTCRASLPTCARCRHGLVERAARDGHAAKGAPSRAVQARRASQLRRPVAAQARFTSERDVSRGPPVAAVCRGGPRPAGGGGLLTLVRALLDRGLDHPGKAQRNQAGCAVAGGKGVGGAQRAGVGVGGAARGAA